MIQILKFSIFMFFTLNFWILAEGQPKYEISEDLIKHLYEKYKEACQEDNKAMNQCNDTLRRLYTQNNAYEIHVQRLKEVNGYKTHNLYIRSGNNPDNPFIYINNPVESKMPNAYLSLNEFRAALTGRIQKQKDDLVRNNKRKRKLIFVKVPKNKNLDKPTRTNSKLRSYSTMTTDKMRPNISTSRYLIKLVKNKKHVKPKTTDETEGNTRIPNINNEDQRNQSEEYYESASYENVLQETTRKKNKKIIIRHTKNPTFESLQSIEDHTLADADDFTTVTSNRVKVIIKTSRSRSMKIPFITKYSSTDTASRNTENYKSTDISKLTSTGYNQTQEGTTIEPPELIIKHNLISENTITETPTKSDLITNEATKMVEVNPTVTETENAIVETLSTGNLSLNPTGVFTLPTILLTKDFITNNKDNDVDNILRSKTEEPKEIVMTTDKKVTTNIAVENRLETPVIGLENEGFTTVKVKTIAEISTTNLEEIPTISIAISETSINTEEISSTILTDSPTVSPTKPTRPEETRKTSVNAEEISSTIPIETTTVSSAKPFRGFIPYADNPFIPRRPGASVFVPTTRITKRTTTTTKRTPAGRPYVFMD